MLLSLISSKARSGSRADAEQYARLRDSLACLVFILSNLTFSNLTTQEGESFVLKNVARVVQTNVLDSGAGSMKDHVKYSLELAD